MDARERFCRLEFRNVQFRKRFRAINRTLDSPVIRVISPDAVFQTDRDPREAIALTETMKSREHSTHG